MSPYKCPKHGVWLVRRERAVKKRAGRMENLSFFACPVCDYVKPDKWQKKPTRR